MFRKFAVVLSLILGGILVLISGAVAVLYLTNSGDDGVLATTAGDQSLPFVELDGYRFHAEMFGDAEDPLVIALHGGPGGDYRYILPLKELTEDGYRVLFYDQRGSGLSPRVGAEELTLDRFIADLDLFIDEFSPDAPVAIVGHSWGAMLASAYIGVHPGKVDRLVLAEPGMLDEEHSAIFYEKTGLRETKMTGPMVRLMAAAWAKSLHVGGPDEQARPDFLARALMQSSVEGHPLAGYYPEDDLVNASAEDWRFGSLASSTIPATGMDAEGKLICLASGGAEWIAAGGRAIFMAGSENSIIGPEFQQSQMHYYPGAELAVIDGAGHTMIGEKPEESLDVIRKFMEG